MSQDDSIDKQQVNHAIVSIEKLAQQTANESRTMMRLTRVVTLLTFLNTVLTGANVWPAVRAMLATWCH
jgi:hypothetical protein